MDRTDPGPLGRVTSFSRKLARIPHLAAMLGADTVDYPPRPWAADHVVGWGIKPNTRIPRRVAARFGVPFVALEDAFLRSVGLGIEGEAPLGVIVDPVGVHYDAHRESRIERILAGDGPDDPLDDPALLARARRCIDAIRAAKLSKYNDAPDVSLGPKERPRVLVVDQTATDISIRRGMCAPGGFAAMLAAARREHPDAEIVVKTHPDVVSGKRRGNLTEASGVRLVARLNTSALLAEVDRVYVMTSLVGCEALLAGLPVTTFGVPFYAGWGLTEDRAAIPERRGRARSVEQLFAAAYLLYARYADPETGERCEVERVIAHLSLQREIGARSAKVVVCVGFSAWKRAFVPSFVRGPGSRVVFAGEATEAAPHLDAEGAVLLTWGAKRDPALRRLSAERGAPIWRMEDGFLRSVGLGSDLYAPASLVVDPRGLYYDPATESELEHILTTAAFDDAERARAAALRSRIVEARISKYNVGVQKRIGPPPGDPREVVLVVGQVEDDASIQRGCVDVRRHEDLVRAARAARPHAYSIYKPHPDVVSGNRSDSLPLSVAARICDEVVVDASLPACLAVASEVHTMTSLVGFEALLRGLSVVCYGQPFYAGWGLTEDRCPPPRRARRLSLDELVAGTLIRYPRYVHPATGRYTTPEAIVDVLSRAPRPKPWESTWTGRQLRKLQNLTREVLRAP